LILVCLNVPSWSAMAHADDCHASNSLSASLFLLVTLVCHYYCSPRTLAVTIAHLALLLLLLVFGSAGSGPSRWTIAMGLAGGDCKLSARRCCRLEWGCPFRLSATPTMECRTPSISLLRRTGCIHREEAGQASKGLCLCIATWSEFCDCRMMRT